MRPTIRNTAGGNPNSNAARAKRWLIAHYPLLGSLLTQFELVEDIELCRRMDISILHRPRRVLPPRLAARPRLPFHRYGSRPLRRLAMQRDELGKALDAVVSYSQAQAVKQVRLVYCDATLGDNVIRGGSMAR